MIKEIKKNREIYNLNKIIDKCVPISIHIQHKENLYYFFDKVCLFIVSDDIDIRYKEFLNNGVSEMITEHEIEKILYERFNIENKVQ